MEHILPFLNENPALLSVVGFPLGLYLLMKVTGLSPGAFVKALNAHTAAELKIEERIQDTVNLVEISNAAGLETRTHFDIRIAAVVVKLDDIQRDVALILGLMKKRKSDYIHPSGREWIGDAGRDKE